MMEQLLDVAIIGGGPAGLSAALVLGRARRRVAVIDEGLPRNRVTRESHGFLTRDGIEPGEFRRIAREQISAYPTVRFVEDAVVSASGNDGNFQITTARGSIFRSKKLIFATGMKDAPLAIDGLADVYGKSAFVCPYCDGWEMRDRMLAVIVRGPEIIRHMAKTIAGWTDRYAICTNGPDGCTDEVREELKLRGVPLYESPIRRIESSGGQVLQVVLEDGTAIDCEGIFFAPKLVPGSDLPQALGCRMTEDGAVVVDNFGKTTVPGVYSAGDAATKWYQVVNAASMGAFAAMSINGELLAEAWEKRAETNRSS
jgi:thioredoxin reductase